MKIAITGHRPGRIAGQEQDIKKWIIDCIGRLDYKEDIEEAYCGMAMGTDQIFANVAEAMNVPLICCYPYRRDNFHPAEQRINAKAKDVRFISEQYSKKVYWIRDKYMVDNCDVLLAVFDGEKVGGTWITVDYAQKIGKPVVFYEFR